MLRLRVCIYFLFFSLKCRINPLAFFQLNAEHFNVEKKIYSKYDIEKNIPKKYKLHSWLVGKHTKAKHIKEQLDFPVFLKPEWWENSHGVFKANDTYELKNILKKIKREKIPYLYQQASSYKDEFDILYIKDTTNPKKYALISISKLLSNSDEAYPINMIKHGIIRDRTSDFSEKQLQDIYDTVREMWDFKLARISIKADSIDDIKNGTFQVFEMNIFLPLLPAIKDKTYSLLQRERILLSYISLLTKAVRDNPIKDKKNILLNMLKRKYMIKISNNKYISTINAWVYKKIEKKFMNGCSDYNPSSVRRNTRSKKQARDMFEKLWAPHANGEIFFWPWAAKKFVEKHGFPVVIKPNVSWFSRGSYFPITSMWELYKAIFLAKIWWPKTVIESYLDGHDHRIVVTNDGVQIVMERFPPFVVWDGKTSISELINQENAIRDEMQLGPSIHNIKKDNPLILRHLKKQKLTLESIPKADETIFLFHRVALAPGWVLKNIWTETVTKKNEELFMKVLKGFNSNIFWLDVIFEKWVHIDYDKQKCIFLEVNCRPYLKMHHKPRYGEKPDMKTVYAKLDALNVEWKWAF